MTRKVLPREWAQVLSLLAAIVGVIFPPEVADKIISAVSNHGGDIMTTLGLLGALVASIRGIYVGKKEARNETDSSNSTV